MRKAWGNSRFYCGITHRFAFNGKRFSQTNVKASSPQWRKHYSQVGKETRMIPILNWKWRQPQPQLGLLIPPQIFLGLADILSSSLAGPWPTLTSVDLPWVVMKPEVSWRFCEDGADSSCPCSRMLLNLWVPARSVKTQGYFRRMHICYWIFLLH